MEEDSAIPAREGASSQLGECHRDVDFNAHILGTGGPILFKASVCLDHLCVVTQLLGGIDRGGGLRVVFRKELLRLRFEGSIWPPMEKISIRMASDGNAFVRGAHYARCLAICSGILLGGGVRRVFDVPGAA